MNWQSLLFLLLTSLPAYGYLPGDSTRVKHTGDFKITGTGADPAWKAAAWIELPKREGDSGYQTRAKLLYSQTGLYVFFDCPDSKITATKTEDFTDLWREDVFEIFLWTDESTPLYFEYELSPLNRELALLVPNFDGKFLGWVPWQYEGNRRIVHEVHVRRDNNKTVTGWSGEFFIPYALLKPLQNVPPNPGIRWRMNMYRIDYDGSAHSEWAWCPVQTNFHEFKSFGVLIFD